MTAPDAAAQTLFSGKSEIGALARTVDWDGTPLGRVSSWPQSLRAIVRTLLSSQYPMVLTWGSRFTQIYNDAYAKLIGSGHPEALGEDIRVTLAAGWDTLGPMIARVMQTGEANWTPALPLLMERAGYREEAYFSVSHAPAEDDEGRIVGMLAVCSEVTAQVVGERRLCLLRDLAAKAGETRSVEATCSDLATVLSENQLDVPFALLFLQGHDGDLRQAVVAGIDVNHPAAQHPGTVPWPFEAVLAGQTLTVDGLNTSLGLTGGFWEDPIERAMVMPMTGEAASAAFGTLVLGISPSRELDARYRDFLNLVAGQVSTALRNARAYEEERRRAEALAELDRAKTQFFSNISHEFRTPLTLMLGPLEDVLASGSLESRVRADLDVAYRNALRLLRLVNTLLDFSRVEAGRAQAIFAPVDLPAFTADIASSFRSAFERGGLTFVVECLPLSDPVFIDRDMWEKVVLNLLSNAFKFTFRGSVKVRLEPVPSAVRLTVADTGGGIPAEALPRIFERFHRVENSRSRSHEGSGIGLALVRELAGMHGGTVEVASQIDRGTTFTVVVPTGTTHLPQDRIIASCEAPVGRAAARTYVEEALHWLPVDEALNVVPLRPGISVSSSGRSRIVLADDNADMRAYVQRLLGVDYEIVAVADGNEALTALRRGRTDLLLTDVMMPELDGIALTRAVRADPTLRTLPIIILSARAGAEAGVEGLEAGADDYLVKPFSARELQARVRANLELSRLRREVEEQAAQERKMEAVGQLTSGVAHDFNNLLAAVMGSVELAERKVTDERVLRLLHNAYQAAQRGAKLTEQLLAFSRRQRLEALPTDLNGVLSGMADLLHRTLGGTIAVSTRLAAELWPAMADPNRVELAVLNLAVNARDAMPKGGELRIETANVIQGGGPSVLPSGDFVQLSVADTGEGMPPNVMARLFEPFFTTKPQGKGTGLGLAQVYGTAKQLGGEVTVHSIVGQGTRVTLYLPRASAQVASADCTPETTRGTSEKRRILLVDDDVQVRSAAASLLEELGHEVVVLAAGPEAIGLLAQDKGFDLVLADFAMPGMTGAELATRAAAMQPGLRVLLMTGYADAAALPENAPVLRKPFTLSDLAYAVGYALRATPAQVLPLPPARVGDEADRQVSTQLA
jgi:signal transduction histidine kinase